MNTILYIGNSYISTLEQLRNCVFEAFNNEKKHVLIREIETLYHDEVLQHWLEEGGNEERQLAKELRAIKQNIDSSKLRECIVLILTDEMYNVNRCVHDYLSIENYMVYADNVLKYQLKEGGDNKINISHNCNTITVKLLCRVLRSEAETFELAIYNNGNIIGDNVILNLRNYSEGQLVNIEIPLNGIKKTQLSNLSFTVDKQTISSVYVNKKD